MGANRFEREIEALIAEHGGVQVQTVPHRKWKFPAGQVFVASATPSDHRAARNQLRDLKRLLGVKRPEPAETREKNEETFRRVNTRIQVAVFDNWKDTQMASFREKLSAALAKMDPSKPA